TNPTNNMTHQNFARWDGFQWSETNLGFGNATGPLATYNGEVYISDYTNVTGTIQHLVRWDGATVRDAGPGVDNGVDALAIWNNRLVAGGDFGQAGGPTV